MREKVYRLSIGLSLVFGVEALYMAMALKAGGYNLLAYGKLVLLPIFIPALLAAIVVTGIYVHGFTRRSWTARTAERIFFFVFALAVAAKFVLFHDPYK